MRPQLVLAVFTLLLLHFAYSSPDGDALLAWKRTWKTVPAQVTRTWRGNNPCNSVPAWFGISCNDLSKPNVRTQRVTQINFDDPEGKPVNFAGPLDKSIGRLSNLQFIDLFDFPRLTGALPKELKNLKRLVYVSLISTGLSGSLEPLASIPNLQYLWVDSNKFSGALPTRLPKSMVRMGFYNEKLTGKWPAWKDLPNLQSIEMDNISGVKGKLPATYSTLGRIDELVFRKAGLTGPLPPVTSLPKNMRFLRFDGNRFSGALPTSWGNKGVLPKLRRLDLFNNGGLTGTVPAAWAKTSSRMRSVELYLRPNTARLCGKVPKALKAYDNKTDGLVKDLGSCRR